jgi:hypothetical protein
MSRYYKRRLAYDVQFWLMVGKLLGDEIDVGNGHSKFFKLKRSGKLIKVNMSWVTEST